MPHTKSAKKSLRQTEKRRLRNRATKKGIKVQLKKFLAVVETGSPEELKNEYNLAAKKLDKAAAHNVVHKNLASRKKAQLAKMVNKKIGEAKAPAAS